MDMVVKTKSSSISETQASTEHSRDGDDSYVSKLYTVYIDGIDYPHEVKR